MLLMALFAPWAANAQTTTVTVGTGTSTYGLAPITNEDSYSLCQMLYRDTELGEAPGTITSIAFQFATTYEHNFPIEVYMLSVLDGYLDGDNPITGPIDDKLVFDGFFYVSQPGWATINLDTPFEYNGASNLLVVVKRKNYNISNINSVSWNCSQSIGVTTRYASGNYVPHAQPQYTSSYRPNTQFVINLKNTVTIGSGSATNCYLPTRFFDYYGFTQQIYTAEELGDAGLLTGIDFYCTEAMSGGIDRDIDVYLVNTNKNSFQNNTDWIPVSILNRQFSGQISFRTSQDWTHIPLDGFYYDGHSNVAVVLVDKSGNIGTYNNIEFAAFEAQGQALWVYKDVSSGGAYNPGTLSSPPDYEGTIENYKNQIRVVKEPASAQPESFVTIGTSTDTYSYAPITISSNSNYSLTQMLYLASELGETAGTINSIAFQYAGTEACNFPIEVYMLSVPDKDLNGDNPITGPIDDKIVFNGTYSVSQPGWATIDLDTPFEYDGASSLLVVVKRNSYLVSNPNNVKWNCTHISNYSIRTRYTTNNSIPHAQPANTTTSRPNTRFAIDLKNTVTIGSGLATNYYLPTRFYSTYALTQQIYTAEELGDAGLLKSIVFLCTASTAGYQTRDLDVYLVNTNKNSFQNETDWIPVSVLNRQFSGQISFGTSQAWTSIPLDGFYYDGQSNVAVVIVDKTGTVGTYSHTPFAAFDAPGQALRIYKTESGSQNPYSPGTLGTPPDYEGTIENSKCQMRVVKEELPASNDVFVTIGTGTTTSSNAPITNSTNTNFSLTQMLYLATELGETPATINSLAFQYAGTQACNFPVQIFMLHVSAQNLSGDNPFSGSIDDKIVFNGTLSVTEPGWATINLDTPFEYDGASNLLVVVNKRDYLIPNPENVKWYNTSTLNQIMTRYAPGNYINNYQPHYTSTFRPNTRFGMTVKNTSMVGSGTGTNSYLPTCAYSYYSLTEQIYTADELGGEGYITSIDFIAPQFMDMTRNIEVFLVSTTKDSFQSETDWICPTNEDLQFSGQVNFEGYGKWITIPLNGFLYDGHSNLAVMVNDNTGQIGSYNYLDFKAYEAPSQALRIHTSDASSYSFIPTMPNYTGTIDNTKNQIRFTKLEPCPAPTGFSVSYDESIDEFNAYAGWVNNGNCIIEVNGVETPNVNCPYVFSVEPGTTYTVRVRCMCENGALGYWTEPVVFTTPAALTVLDGADENSQVPLYGLWVDKFSKSQFIIPASELQNMTYGTINKLTFYAEDQMVNWGGEFEIYMTEVGYTTFETANLVDWSNMTKVMNSSTLSVSNNIMEITLDTPYEYDGGNLLIGLLQTVQGTYKSCSWIGENQTTNTAIGGYENSKALSTQKFLPKTTFNYTPGETPSCLKPSDVAVNYTGGTEATLSWNGWSNAYNIDLNGSIIEGVVGRTYTLTGLEYGTNYQVKVQAICNAENLSNWTAPVIFTTDLCAPEDQCELTFVLTDSYGDGWNGNAIKVVDAATGIEIATMANEDLDGTTQVAETQTYTLPVCNGREIQFVWVPGSYANEASYTVLDANGEEIFSGSGALSEPVNYTVDCSCPVPANFDLWYNQNIMASLTWDLGANAYNIEVNGEVTEGIAYAQTSNTTANYILNDLEAHTTYTVRLQAVCENGNSSEWTDPVTFTTTCEEYNVCGFNFEFICNSSAGFQDGYLEIIDVETGEQLWRLDTWDEGEEPLPWSLPQEFFVCTGREVQFVWWGPKTSDYTYALHDAGGEELASGYLSDLPFNYTANCEYVCETPTDLAIIDYEINYNQNDVAILSWDGGDGWASYYNISVNGEVIDTAGDNQYALDLEYNTTYEVRVQRVCYFTLTSEWSDPLVFTSMCDQYDEDGLCELNYSLIDENNNGFEEGVIEIIDVQTNAVVWHFIASDDFENEPYNQLDNEFFMCPGHEFRIVWDGPVGEGYRFVLYEPGGDDIATYPLSDLLIDMPPVTYTPNCEEQIIIQEVTMPAGTNWYSFEVNITLAELQAALVAAMDEAGVTVTPDNPIIIKTKDKTTRYNGSIWRGNLTVLAPNEMYMITLPGSGEIQLEGTAATPEEDLIIHYGTNWFVYPADQSEMTLNNAFAGFAVAGDKIKTKDATATCFGSFWRGNLTKIQPGENYIYESVVTEDRVLVFPTSK